jgi:acyl carrier protein
MLKQPEITSEIRKIVSRITRVDISELSDEVRVREELGIDSLMAMEIVASCEKQFNIHIDEDQLFRIETIGDFYRLVIQICTEGTD